MHISDIMSRNPVTVAPHATCDEAMERMEGCDFRHLPVQEGDEIVGILSDRDLRLATGWTKLGSGDESLGPLTVDKVMRKPVVCVEAQAPLREAVGAMLEKEIAALPVIEAGELVGIVTALDLLRVYLEIGPSPDPVREAMATNLVTISPDRPIDEIVTLCREHHFHHLPVVDEEGRLIGIVSDRDIWTALGRDALKDSENPDLLLTDEQSNQTVADIMTADVVTIEVDEEVSDAITEMLKRKIDALPVTDKGKLVGIITDTDILMKVRLSELK